MEDCIFCKIIKREIPSSKIYEDENVFVFLDIAPINKGHTLIVPKEHSTDLTDMDEKATKAVFLVAKKLAPKIMDAVGADGFNIMVNNRPAAGQLVFHTHIHVIPRFKDDGLKHWTGKKLPEDEMKETQKRIKDNL